ncbi:nucleotidyltransferase [candidate division KSB1 bacterium]|nr:nucleotidyltransferase [candidate division KSB1 bacterium]
MSFDESFLAELVQTLAAAKVQAIFIGNAAAVLQGIPVMTHDVDLMVREHPQLEKKLQKFSELFGVTLSRPYEPSSRMLRASGRSIGVDFVFALSSRKSFESIRSRAKRIRIGNRMVLVASLEDVIAAKEAANRPKDKATLPILREALETRNSLARYKNNNQQRRTRDAH